MKKEKYLPYNSMLFNYTKVKNALCNYFNYNFKYLFKNSPIILNYI